jgi:hypothetical protein
MAKLSNALRNNPRGPVGPIVSEPVASGQTHQGGAGFARDPKSELFLLATTNFVGEDTFYEDAKGRDTRFRDLVRTNALHDPQWTADMLRWLRHEANMRSASIVGAIEAAKALAKAEADANIHYQRPAELTPRRIVDSVLLRADEPAEVLGYWLAAYGKPVPKWLKRALGDAILRLYTEFNVCKWDSERNPLRFADVLEYSQITRTKGTFHETLFTYLLDARHGRGSVGGLPKLSYRAELLAMPPDRRRAWLRHAALTGNLDHALRSAAMTWEALSGWLNDGKGMDAEAWGVAIPIMGYGALIKNLRNFDQAAISVESRQRVASVLTDPEAVAKSRLLPMAFLNAYNQVPSDFWRAALDQAATHALAAVPALPGRTLVLIDTSSSMNAPFTTHKGRQHADVEKLMRWDVAALFGVALGCAAKSADVVSFSSAGYGWSWSTWDDGQGCKQFDLRKGENLLAAVARFRKTHFIGGGTDTAAAVRTFFKGQDRVIVLTDEQANHDPGGVFAPVPANIPTYTFNLAGDQHGHAATGPGRHVMGGLSDAGFKLLSILETRHHGRWPWDN